MALEDISGDSRALLRIVLEVLIYSPLLDKGLRLAHISGQKEHLRVSQNIHIIENGIGNVLKVIFSLFTDLKRYVQAKKHLTIEFHHSIIVMTICDNTRSQGVKFDDVFFMCTEIGRTDSARTGEPNFRATM